MKSLHGAQYLKQVATSLEYVALNSRVACVLTMSLAASYSFDTHLATHSQGGQEEMGHRRLSRRTDVFLAFLHAPAYDRID